VRCYGHWHRAPFTASPHSQRFSPLQLSTNGSVIQLTTKTSKKHIRVRLRGRLAGVLCWMWHVRPGVCDASRCLDNAKQYTLVVFRVEWLL